MFTGEVARTRETRLIATATVLTLGITIVFAVVFATFFVALAVNGDDGVSDNWVGYLTGITLYASIFITFFNFTIALAYRVAATEFPLRWLAAWEFPILIVLLLVVELAIIE